MFNPIRRALKKAYSILSPKIEQEESMFIRGEVEITAKDSGGNVIFQHDDKNVILDAGKYKIMDILRDTAANKEIAGTTMSISRFSIGDGGAAASSLNVPKTLDKTRTSLYNEVHRKDVTSHSKPDQNSIEFIVDILSDDLAAGDFNAANGGEYVNEAGLVLSISGTYTSGHPLTVGVTDPLEVALSHKTHKSVPFTPGLGITLTYRWKIFISM